ncbi:MAG: hypothetical protein IPO85_18775 [Saprospiraceae bacterium]|uniref:Uncharacterized protein n=1 Tax=Candidatus Defluviibacterium haderslevense TaxID=2981993 RepID=A0A9D7XJB3_9BACT|nr:hypothetical protein [Candidatus Defluviibacterium haderslevense]
MEQVINIGENYFLPALHVVNNARQCEEIKIVYFSQITDKCVNLNSYKVVAEFPESAIALIQNEEIVSYSKKLLVFKWSFIELIIFEQTKCMEFPDVYNVFKGMLIGNGFTGTILSEISNERVELKTACYELTFQTPRGLSVWFLVDKNYFINEIIIGNSQKKMNEFKV